MHLRTPSTALSVVLALALAATAAADWPAAVAAYQSGDYQTAAAGFAEVIETTPEFAGAHYMLGLCHQQLRDYSTAVVHLARAHELAPGHLDTTLAYGQTLLLAKEPSTAYSVLREIELDGVSAAKRTAAVVMLANAAIGADQAASVVESLRAAVADNSSRADIHRLLGAALEATGDLRGAASAFASAVAIDPSDAVAGRGAIRTALAAFRRLDDDAERTAVADSALAAAQTLVQAEANHEHLLLAGEAALAARAYNTAVTWFAEAHELEPDDALTRLYLGQSLYASDQLKAAQQELDALRTTRPSADIERRACSVLAKIAEKDLALERAAELHRCAGDRERAAMIAELAERFSDALEERDRLLGEIADSRKIVVDLIDINEIEPARKMETRIATLEAQVAQIDRNLEEVEAALR